MSKNKKITNISEESLLTPAIMAKARQLLLAEQANEPEGMPTFEVSKVVKGNLVKSEVPAVQLIRKAGKGEVLELYNPKSGRYVEAKGTVGRELRKNPEYLEKYQTAAALLGREAEVKGVAQRLSSSSARSRSKQGPSEAEMLEVTSPEKPDTKIAVGSRDFERLLKSDKYKDKLLDELAKQNKEAAKLIRQSLEPENVGMNVLANTKGTKHWIKLGRPAFVELAISNPAQAKELLNGQHYTDEEKTEQSKLNAKERSLASRNSLGIESLTSQNLMIKVPEVSGIRSSTIKFGGPSYIERSRAVPGYKEAADKAFREQFKNKLTPQEIEEDIALATSFIKPNVTRKPSSRSSSSEEEEKPMRRASSRSSSEGEKTTRNVRKVPTKQESEEESESDEEEEPIRTRRTRQ